jgi:outer membrane protein, multidrug efflux system
MKVTSFLLKNSPMRLVAPLGCCLFFTGCAVGPDYETPSLSLPKTFEETTEKAKANNEVLKQWWCHFDDSVLNNLIDTALSESLTLQAAMARVNQSRALARQAFSELLPGAQLSGVQEKSRVSGARFPGASPFEYRVYTGSVDALWEIDFFGRLRRELESRNASHGALVAEYADAMRVLTADVALTYLDFRATQTELEIAKKNREIQKQSLELIKTQFQYGEVAELDLARSETQYEQTSSLVPPLEAKVAAHRRQLAVLLGITPDSLPNALSEPAALPAFTGPDKIGSPRAMIRRRPDVKAAERRLASANATIGAAVGELFPKISFNGSLGVEAARFSNLDSNADTFRYGPSITWTAFDIGRLRSVVRVREAETEEALATYHLAVLRALEDTENSLAHYRASTAAVTHARAAAASAKKAFDLASIRYNAGETDFLTVLDTQRTLLQAETELVSREKDVSQGAVGIYKALGGGWSLD